MTVSTQWRYKMSAFNSVIRRTYCLFLRIFGRWTESYHQACIRHWYRSQVIHKLIDKYRSTPLPQCAQTIFHLYKKKLPMFLSCVSDYEGFLMDLMNNLLPPTRKIFLLPSTKNKIISLFSFGVYEIPLQINNSHLIFYVGMTKRRL